MTIAPAFKYVERFSGGIQWQMMETKDIIINISFKLKNKNGDLVPLKGESLSFRLSIKEIFS